jgi:hypothetical protein
MDNLVVAYLASSAEASRGVALSGASTKVDSLFDAAAALTVAVIGAVPLFQQMLYLDVSVYGILIPYERSM